MTTKLELPGPPPGASHRPWPVRVTDIDLHGHLNNAAYWHAIEEHLAPQGVPGGLDPARPLRALLDYRQPIGVDDDVQLVDWPAGDDSAYVAFVVQGDVKAVARLELLAS